MKKISNIIVYKYMYVSRRSRTLQEFINSKELGKCFCSIFWAFFGCCTLEDTPLNSSPISGRRRFLVLNEISWH